MIQSVSIINWVLQHACTISAATEGHAPWYPSEPATDWRTQVGQELSLTSVEGRQGLLFIATTLATIDFFFMDTDVHTTTTKHMQNWRVNKLSTVNGQITG